jgi:hypothetical protein
VSGVVDYIADPFKLSAFSEAGGDLVAAHANPVGDLGGCLVPVGLEEEEDCVAL